VLSARRCFISLDSLLYRYFDRYYRTGSVIVLTQQEINQDGVDVELERHIADFPEALQSRFRLIDASMRMQLGRALMEQKISPVSGYMRPVDVRDLERQHMAQRTFTMPSNYLRVEVAA